jgi:hypothetical protein
MLPASIGVDCDQSVALEQAEDNIVHGFSRGETVGSGDRVRQGTEKPESFKGCGCEHAVG